MYIFWRFLIDVLSLDRHKEATRMLLKDNIYYIGQLNKEETTFEGVIPTPNGMNYNSYLILDEKTCLLDTVDETVLKPFLFDVDQTLNHRLLDYLVVHHLEPDHTAGIVKILKKYPDVTLVISFLGLKLLNQFFTLPEGIKTIVVKDGDILNLGKHELVFKSAPMVHWPEVMMSYDTYSHVFFSADAFGSFNAITKEEIYATKENFDLDEARRYYTNIVGKYGPQVQDILKKVSSLSIEMICPLHGHIFKDNFELILSYYEKWSAYQGEQPGVLLLVASIYGHTYQVAKEVKQALAEDGIKVNLINLNTTHVSEALSQSFVYSNIVLFASTFNMGLFTPMENYLNDFQAHMVRNKNFTIVENGSWAPQAGRIMKDMISSVPGNIVNEKIFSIRSSLKENSLIDEIKSAVELSPNIK
jgi:flavorubredoxin